MSQLINDIKRRIPWINIRSMLMWETILETYPLSHSKIDLINKSGDGIIVGVMTDHLMKVARKVGVPSSYIKNLSLTRQEYKRYKRADYLNLTESGKDSMIIQTCLLLSEVSIRIRENKSLVRKIRDKK